jgi:Ca2+-binding EF-hand superfamily protein
MSNQQLRDEYKSLFEIYDRNTSGDITHAEFKSVISDAGIELGEEDIAGILAGQPEAITCEIFTKVLSDCCKPPHTESEVVSAFKVFDKASTGKADYAELNYVFEILGDGISEAMIHGFMH